MTNDFKVSASQTQAIYEKLKTTLPDIGKWPADTKAEIILGAILLVHTQIIKVEE